MLGIRRMYSQLMGNVFYGACGMVEPASNTSTSLNLSSTIQEDDDMITILEGSSNSNGPSSSMAGRILQVEALTRVFGMDKTTRRIEKKKACEVVRKLGLEDREEAAEEMLDHLTEEEVEELVVMDLQVEEEEERTTKLLKQAFMVFDEDGDGYIDAREIKRVLLCLGLDGWDDLSEIEKMIRTVDLNLDGKVDFHEFQLMMMGTAS